MGKQDILLITRLIRLFVFFVFLSLSLQRNSSISGSTRGMYQVSERRSSPSTGWVSNTLLYIRHMSYPFIVPLYHEELYETHVDVHWKRDAKAGCWGRQYIQKASLHFLTPECYNVWLLGKKPLQKTAMCTFTKCIFNNILTARVLMVNNVLCSSTQCYTQMSNVQMFILCINPALHPSLNPEDHTNLRV